LPLCPCPHARTPMPPHPHTFVPHPHPAPPLPPLPLDTPSNTQVPPFAQDPSPTPCCPSGPWAAIYAFCRTTCAPARHLPMPLLPHAGAWATPPCLPYRAWCWVRLCCAAPQQHRCSTALLPPACLADALLLRAGPPLIDVALHHRVALYTLFTLPMHCLPHYAHIFYFHTFLYRTPCHYHTTLPPPHTTHTHATHDSTHPTPHTHCPTRIAHTPWCLIHCSWTPHTLTLPPYGYLLLFFQTRWFGRTWAGAHGRGRTWFYTPMLKDSSTTTISRDMFGNILSSPLHTAHTTSPCTLPTTTLQHSCCPSFHLHTFPYPILPAISHCTHATPRSTQSLPHTDTHHCHCPHTAPTHTATHTSAHHITCPSPTAGHGCPQPGPRAHLPYLGLPTLPHHTPPPPAAPPPPPPHLPPPSLPTHHTHTPHTPTWLAAGYPDVKPMTVDQPSIAGFTRTTT